MCMSFVAIYKNISSQFNLCLLCWIHFQKSLWKTMTALLCEVNTMVAANNVMTEAEVAILNHVQLVAIARQYWQYLKGTRWNQVKPISPGQNGRHFADDVFKHIFVNSKKNCILIWISLKVVPTGPIDNKPPLVPVMAWRRTGDKPLPEPMLTQLTDAYTRY